MKSARWAEITPSEYAWEREALDYIKARLPGSEPFRAWSNFEFIAEDGSINEVDLLVVSLHQGVPGRDSRAEWCDLGRPEHLAPRGRRQGNSLSTVRSCWRTGKRRS